MRLYFAYGSNLWRQQMAECCPEHREVDNAILHGYRWIISARGYANIVTSPSDAVQGKAYEISATDEVRLDRYEGVQSGSYRKEILTVEVGGRYCSCLVYVDPVKEEGEPKEEYIERLNRGIVDAGLSASYVNIYLRRYVPM